MTRIEEILIRGRRIKINLWQEGLITDKLLQQLQEEPKVIIGHPVGTSSSSHNDRNVPDLNHVASYLECETVNIEEAVCSTNNVDRIEQNLSKMFKDDDAGVRKIHTKPLFYKKNNRKRKRQNKSPEEFRRYLLELFGDLSDEADTTNKVKRKKIEKRRRTLPVSINLKPLKIIHKRKSETDAIHANSTQEPKKIHSPVVPTILEDIEFATTSPLVKFEKIAEVAHSSVQPSNDFDTMRNVIITKSVVCESNTQKTVQTSVVQTEMASEIVDLTEDDSEYISSGVEGCEKSVKEEFISSNSEKADAPARGASMPLLSPLLPAEATLEPNLPSETSKIRSFRISDKLFENSNNQTEATQRPPPAPSQVVTSSKESAESNTHAFFSNLQMLATKTRIPPNFNEKKTCQQNQKLQVTLTSIQKAAELQAKQVKTSLPKSVPILQDSNKKQQQQITISDNMLRQEIQKGMQQSVPLVQHQQVPSTVDGQISQQQRTMIPRQQQQEDSVAVHQQVNRFSQQQSTLKRSLSLHDQMQKQNANKRQQHQLRQQQELGNSSVHHQQQTMLQRSMSLQQQQQQQQQQSNLVDQHFQRSLNLREQSLNVNQRQNPPPPPQENLTLLHQLVQNSGRQPVQTTLPHQPPQMMRIFPAPTESYQVISNSVCADILCIQIDAYMKWFENAHNFQQTVDRLLTNTIFKPGLLTFGKYCTDITLAFGNKIIRDLLPFDVERFNIQEIFSFVSMKLRENGNNIGPYYAICTIYCLIKRCKATCTTPFTKKFFTHLEMTYYTMEGRTQNTVWNVVNLKRLETQIWQYHHISKWLQTKMGISSDTARNQKTSRKKGVSSKQHQTTTVPSVPSIRVQSHIIIPPSGQQDKPCQQTPSSVPSQQNTNLIQSPVTNVSMVPSVQKPNLIQSPVMNVSIVPSTQQQSNTTNTENENNTQEISVYAEPLPSVQPPREEPDTTTDDDVVDLTWIDDGDEDEIAEEIKDCKAFLFKVETDEEKISSPVGEVRSISPDSGCGSPHLQTDDPPNSQEYWCWCGNKAIFVCVCRISMYCSSECQTKDWADHQNLCRRIQSSNKQ